MLQKPTACAGCSLAERGTGYVPGEGPAGSPIAFVAEAAGRTEAQVGRPLVGDAGGMFQRLLNLLGWSRDAFRLDNCARCNPVNDWFDPRAPWYYSALQHCQYVEHETLSAGSTVVVALGGTALRRLLHLEHAKDLRVADWHGAIVRDPTDRYWVVPTFHPSFLQRGAHNLIGTVLWDLRRAELARDHGRPADTSSLVVDPPLDWFRAWVDQVVAARQQDPAAYPVSSDVETADKIGGQDEGELGSDDTADVITRVNVACHVDEGVTVPFEGGYVDELRRLHRSPGVIWEFNREYDFGRQVRAGLLTEADSPKVVDLMWLWHVLQSDLPRGLGFVAPFYSQFGPWKHLAKSEPARYGAIDGLQTHRVGFGVYRDLQQTGQFAVALRHTHELLTKVLRPAQLVGLKVDRQQLQVFTADLTEKARRSLAALTAIVPAAICPLTPKQGLTRPPLADVLHVKATALTRRGRPRAGSLPAEIKQELYAKARVVEQTCLREVLVCQTCGQVDVQRRHRCPTPPRPDPRLQPDPDGADPDRRRAPHVVLAVATVSRWFWQEPFNPDSPAQVLQYLKYRKHQPGRAKKSDAESTNRETLERLERTTKDPFYTHLLDYRAVGKVKGTYAEGTARRLDKDDRLHPVPTFAPSTGRLSYRDPNCTNLISDKGVAINERVALAAGFRRCIVAGPGCRLLEVDFNAIEAILVGERARDPEYIRNAQRGLHAALASHILGRPYDPRWGEDQIVAYLKTIKTDPACERVYDSAKHFNHARAYGLTLYGMLRQYPDLFPTEAEAAKYARFFAEMAPRVEAWQQAQQERAGKEHALGGVGQHPYGYRHWFWSVSTYKRLTKAQELRLVAKFQRLGQVPPVAYINGQPFRVGAGEDSKRALAFDPQSIAAGILKEVMLRLLSDPASPSYIGDVYFGQTPLRAPIHDSLLFEIPLQAWDRTVAIVCREMQRPIKELPLPPAWGLGDYLTIGVSAKAGANWQEMTPIAVPEAGEPTRTAGVEWPVEPMEARDEEEWAGLGRAV